MYLNICGDYTIIIHLSFYIFVPTATGKVLYGYICSKINSSFNLQSNLDVLVKEMDTLLDRSKEVRDDKEMIEKEGNKIRGQVIKWLDDVEKLQPRVNQILEKMVNNKNSSQCFLDCNMWYRKSREGELEEILQEIKRLLEAGCFNSGMI